jgi:hypothetical protein
VADKVSCRLQTGNWDRFLDGLKSAAVGHDGIVALALKDVADEEALPSIRNKTPVDTGKAKRGWRVGQVRLGRKPYINIINRVPYVRLLEYGTLGRRRKKLKEDTMARRRQKTSKALARSTEGGVRYLGYLGSKGGIKPKRMVGRTIRELKAKGSVPRALQRHMKRSVIELRRDVRRIRG